MQHLGQPIDIDLWCASMTVEQRLHRQPIYHAPRGGAANWGQVVLRVAEKRDVSTAGGDHDQRSELRIDDDPKTNLYARGRHGREQHTRSETRGEVCISNAQRRRIGDAELDPAASVMPSLTPPASDLWRMPGIAVLSASG